MSGYINDEIELSKGSYSVTIYAREVNENLQNEVFFIRNVTNPSNQDTGAKDNLAVDLLRIKVQFELDGVITDKSAKDNLRKIIKGGGVSGGEITMTYDGEDFKGYIEECTITERGQDGPTNDVDSQARYTVSLTFSEGQQA
ncbi:MAG: hypothetical protein ACOC5T_09210 [Elusimicrobiota bacterium]